MTSASHRVAIVVLVALLATLVASSVATADEHGDRLSSTLLGRTADSPTLKGVTIPQLHCPTTYGYPVTPPPVKPTATASIPPVLRSELVAHANDVVMVLAPPSWRCKGAVGADGSWTMNVAAAKDTHSVITAQGPGACYGCALDIAAPYFPDAAKLLRELCGSGCVPSRPSGQMVGKLGSEVVYFEGPPTARAPYRTRGVVLFHYDTATSQPFAVEATCSLPSRSVYLCQPILAAFLTEFDVNAHW
jgi:Domain of unknown function (DUF4850)